MQSALDLKKGKATRRLEKPRKRVSRDCSVTIMSHTRRRMNRNRRHLSLGHSSGGEYGQSFVCRLFAKIRMRLVCKTRSTGARNHCQELHPLLALQFCTHLFLDGFTTYREYEQETRFMSKAHILLWAYEFSSLFLDFPTCVQPPSQIPRCSVVANADAPS